MTIVLTASPDTTKLKPNSSDDVANDNLVYSVSIPDKECRLCKNFTLIWRTHFKIQDKMYIRIVKIKYLSRLSISR